MIVTRFPDTPILPSLGNNDIITHYQAVGGFEGIEWKAKYFSGLYDAWFTKVPANMKYLNSLTAS